MKPGAVRHVDLGRIPYRAALERQQDAWRHAVDGGGETVFTLEHDPVITVGRRGDPGDLALDPAALRMRGIDVVETDRGGQLTYHGPGQLVVYPILAARQRGLYAGDLVRAVAGAMADCLGEVGVGARYDTDNPGLWTAGAKVAAVGMRIRQGVSTHGISVNLDVDLTPYGWFVPCGLPTARTTSVAEQVGSAPSAASFGARFVTVLAARVGFDIERVD